jgi:D-sedoheptulose 7-phosphate isomerase
MPLKKVLSDSIDIRRQILDDNLLEKQIDILIEKCVQSLKQGGKILFCGNGGSAADAQHLAAELSGRFAYDRPPLYAEALHVNTSYLTAVANDYSFDEVFARMARAMGRKDDILIAFSTSGNSENIINAVKAAKEIGMFTVAFSGNSGGKLNGLCNLLLKVPSDNTARIQEIHITLGHALCEGIESQMFPK